MDNSDYTLPTTTTILKDYYTDNEAIDHFCDRLQFKKPSWPTTKVGRFAIVDPDVKDMKRGVDKLWAKLKDANLPDHMLNNPNANVFNLITDYARCSILMPDFREAPALITNFLQQVGGEVSHHNRDDYKAFHLHTNVNGVNCEFQFHTFDTYDLKRATDGHYHKWRHAKERDTKAVEANPEYQAEQNFLRPICRKVYDHSGFNQALNAIKKIELERSCPAQHMTDNNFILILRKAMQLQDDLLQIAKGQLELYQMAPEQQVSHESTK